MKIEPYLPGNQATQSQVNGSFQRDPRVVDGSIVTEVGENGDDFVQIGQVLDNVTKAAAKMKVIHSGRWLERGVGIRNSVEV